MYKKIFGLCVFLMLLFALTSTSFAQETTGNIEGTIVDEAGSVVPGISITVRSIGSSAGFRRNVVSGEDGTFFLPQVPPGTYEVTSAEDRGFAAASVDNIIVSLGKTSSVKLTVRPSVSATVSVNATDSAVIDTTDQKIQTNIGQQEIESVPKGTNFTTILKVAPAVRNEPLSGGFQVDGASGSENTFVIDGQEVTNFRTGTLNTNNDLPFQLIQEVQVKSSGFEAEFGGATGGVINVVTKGGNNEFRGEVGIAFTPQRLEGSFRPVQTTFTRNGEQLVEYFQAPKDEGISFFPSASLGGPIIKDRLWFYGSYTPQIFDFERTITSFSNPDPAIRTAVQNDTYRFRQKNEYAFGRIDAAPTDKIRISASYTWNPIIQEGLFPGGVTLAGQLTAGLGGVGSIPRITFADGTTKVGPDLNNFRGGRQTSNITNVQGVWSVTNNIILTARYGYSFLNEKLGNYGIPPVGAPLIRCSVSSINVPAEAGCLNGQSFGANASETLFDISTRKTFDIDGAFFLNLGGSRHAFKAGYQENRLANKIASTNTPDLFIRYGNATNGATVSALSGRPIPTSPGAIGAGQLTRFGTNGDVSSKNQAIFLQDKFQVGNRLTLSLGFRIEKENVPSFVEGLPGIEFNWADKFTPRIGGAYDLTGDGKNKIFANYGWFHDRFKYELPRGSFGGDFFRRDYFEIFPGDGPASQFTIAFVIGTNPDLPGGNCPVPGGIPNSTGRSICQRDFRAPANIPGEVLQVGGIDPDLKPFRQSEFTVGYERQLSQNYIFSSRYTHKQVDRAVEDLGFINSNGAEVFLIGNPGLGLAEQTFLDAGLIPTKAQRDYDAIEVRLDKRLSDNFYFNASYTYSRLFGNYGGLASSDENGRTSPNVNRNFDSPISGFTASGERDNGLLRTDRPHVFKIYGGYNVNWNGNNTTEFSGFQNISSGTPETTNVTVLGVSTIPLFERGDLGRTETFTQTDLGIRHRYRFGRDNRLTLVAELDIINLFDESNVLSLFRPFADGITFDESDFGFTTGTPDENLLNFLRAFQTTSFSSEIVQTVRDAHAVDARYGLPNTFQGPRSVRFGFRLIF